MVEIVNSIRGWLGFILYPLEKPFRWLLEDVLATEGNLLWYLIYDVVALLLVFAFVRMIIGRVRDLFRKKSLADSADIDALVTSKNEFATSIKASQHLESTVEPLIKGKQWAQLGAVYADVGRPKEAAKYFKKARDLKRAAEQLARAGQTVKAAKIMMKSGDFATAGRFFLEKGKHLDAAKAFIKLGNMSAAAAAFADAGKYQKAFAHYKEYFKQTTDPQPDQARAAEKCYALMQDEKAGAKIEEADRAELLPVIALAFERAKRYEEAARLFYQAGDLLRAGQVFVLAGKFQEAAKCMEAAGHPKDAALFAARHFERSGKLPEAAAAYKQAEDYLKAGECFLKAKEPVRAGECFSRAKAYSHAGLAYAQAGRYEDGVAMLQRVPEDDKEFHASRALLGRCFYELHDYEHCAATFENHLLGVRVDTANMEYFYMLALAYEQLGQLKDSRDVLFKIGAVQKRFRDLDQRISNIDSRISMLGSQAGEPPIPVDAATPSEADGKMMGLVENTLGDRYEFQRELGRGGMGVVYLAMDRQLERPVALKFLGSLVDSSEEYKLRFVREARTAAKISHPNIISIYDISASEGKAYIAMEYVEGPNLFQYVEAKGKLSAREAISIMVQSCNALSAIHEAGIVHRDVKPDNILIAKGGLVKLMDFGLAKAEENRITKEGMVMGTPCYMSPEQALAKEVDARADIYALGLILYEMLTGEVVFLDGDVIERQISEVPPKPSELVGEVPPALDEIAVKCVEKDPAKRFQDAKALANALRHVSK